MYKLKVQELIKFNVHMGVSGFLFYSRSLEHCPLYSEQQSFHKSLS